MIIRGEIIFYISDPFGSFSHISTHSNYLWNIEIDFTADTNFQFQ